MSSSHLPLCIAIVLGLFAACAIPAKSAAASKRPARVWIDESHDFLFVTDHFGNYLVAKEGFHIAHSRAGLTADRLRTCDVLVIWQRHTPMPYTKEDLDLIRNFVEGGGGLFLLGSKPGWERSVGWTSGGKKPEELSYPINDVAAMFGAEFLGTKAALPLALKSDPLTAGIETYENLEAWLAGTIRLPSGARVLLADSKDNPVAAALPFGKGRVVLMADASFLNNNDIAHPDKEVNKKMVGKIFNWLAEPRSAKGDWKKIPKGLTPSPESDDRRDDAGEFIELTFTADGGKISLPEVDIIYARGLEDKAKFVAEQFSKANSVMLAFWGVPALGKVRMEALAGGAGGGFTAHPLIAIGSLGGGPAWEKSVKDVVLWELTNAWGLPEANNWTECWACLTETLLRARTGTEFGVGAAMTKLRDADSIRRLDPDLKKIDVSAPNPGEYWRPHDSKLALIFRELHAMYGDAFFQRLVKIHRARHWGDREPQTIEEIVYEFTLAANQDLYGWFASFGTTVTPKSINFEDGKKALNEYEKVYKNRRWTD